MKTPYLILLMAFLFCLPTLAQKKDVCNKAEFRAKQQAYMAKKAELTPEESEKFFPLYFEFLDKKKGINRQTWENSKKGKAPETTDEEYRNIIDQFIDSQEIIVNLEKEYINKYREFLSDKKIYLIYQAEIKFNRNMMKILQKMDDKNK